MLPVPGIHNDVTDAPCGAVHEEPIDMTDFAVGSMYMTSSNNRDAAKMRIALMRPSIGTRGIPRHWCRQGQLRDKWCRHGVAYWMEAAAPIRVPAVIIVDMSFNLPRHSLVRIDIGTVLDLLHGEFDGEATQGSIGLSQSRKRQKNFATWEPVADVNDKPSNDPAVILKQQVANDPELSVASFDGIAIDCQCVPQHVLTPAAPMQHRSAPPRPSAYRASGRQAQRRHPAYWPVIWRYDPGILAREPLRIRM